MPKKANKAKRPKDKYYQLAKEQVRRRRGRVARVAGGALV